VAFGRDPFLADSGVTVAWAVDHPGSAEVAWNTVGNIAPLAPDPALSYLAGLLGAVEVAPCGTRHARQVLGPPMPDLEDALRFGCISPP
jgi:hypothetical protein